VLEHPLKSIPLIIDHDLDEEASSYGCTPRSTRSRRARGGPRSKPDLGHAAPGGMPVSPSEQEHEREPAREQEQKQARVALAQIVPVQR
jgi:hypothetical protein